MMILSDQYEKRVSEIVDKLTADTQLKNGRINYGRKNYWEGASGHKHQIDVSIHNNERCLLVECKCWKNPISVGYILSLLGRVSDISSNKNYKNIRFKGIVVCPHGLQSGAKKVVDHYKEHLAWSKVTNDAEILELVNTHFLYFPLVVFEPYFYSMTNRKAE